MYATAENGTPKFGTLPIAQGGTGATTAANAVTNLGIKDYVVAAGTSGNWTYRKWNSGVAECFYFKANHALTNYSVTTQITNGAYRWITGNIPFPITFTDTPGVVASATHSNVSAVLVRTNITLNYVSLTLESLGDYTGTSGAVSMYVSGYWK
jgi:hypothetical protein